MDTTKTEGQLAHQLTEATESFRQAAKLKTFRQARAELLDFLRSKGWKVDASLKLPQATSPRGDVRAYFKSEAVYVAVGSRLSFRDAMSTGVDIRTEDPQRFMDWLLRMADKAAVKEDETLEGLKETPFGDYGFTAEQIMVMKIILGLKPAYRAESMERHKLGPYSIKNPHIFKLIHKGLIKMRGKAIVLDRAKANKVLEAHDDPPGYSRFLAAGDRPGRIVSRYLETQRPFGVSDLFVSVEEIADICPKCAHTLVLAGKEGAYESELRQMLAAEGDKWEKMPEGWTEESRKSFWESLTGDVKHKVTKCMEKMEGKVDDTGAFCAALRDRVEGPEWRSESRGGEES